MSGAEAQTGNYPIELPNCGGKGGDDNWGRKGKGTLFLVAPANRCTFSMARLTARRIYSSTGDNKGGRAVVGGGGSGGGGDDGLSRKGGSVVARSQSDWSSLDLGLAAFLGSEDVRVSGGFCSIVGLDQWSVWKTTFLSDGRCKAAGQCSDESRRMARRSV